MNAQTHRFEVEGRVGYVSVVMFEHSHGRPRQIYVTVNDIPAHVGRHLDDMATALSRLLYAGWSIGAIAAVPRRIHPGHIAEEDGSTVEGIMSAVLDWLGAGMPEDTRDA